VVIPIGPLTVPGITKAVTEEAEEEIISAGTPPTDRAVGSARLFPLMVINEPTGPEAGEKEVISGLWALETKKGIVRKSRSTAPFVENKRIVLILIQETEYVFYKCQK
jgi:hypothetical protein